MDGPRGLFAKHRSWAIAGLAAGLRALLLPLVLATVLCPPSPACAATQYAEGSFTWGTSSVWATSTSGPFNQAWTAFNYAELLSPTGTISVSGSQSFNGIQFDVTGYVVNGGTLQIGNPSSPLGSDSQDALMQPLHVAHLHHTNASVLLLRGRR